MNGKDNYLERGRFMSTDDLQAEHLQRFIQNKIRAINWEQQIPYPDIPYFTPEDIANEMSDDSPWWKKCREKGWIK